MDGWLTSNESCMALAFFKSIAVVLSPYIVIRCAMISETDTLAYRKMLSSRAQYLDSSS